MKKIHRNRKGIVVPLVAVCLTIILSFVAIAIDGGLLMDRYQAVQAAADAAALAAANDLYYNYQANQGLDPSGTAKDAAVASATANGFPNATVNIPPQSGPYAGLAGYAEVIINYNQRRYFSNIFGHADIPISARAVAQGRWTAALNGILVLNPTLPGSATVTGGGTATLLGAPFIIDSNAPNAGTATGNGTVTATEFDIVGQPGVNGGHWNGPINSGIQPVPDPLAYLPEPDPNTMPIQSKNHTHIAGQKTTTLNPGVYVGGIDVSGQGLLVMNPGIYYMQGGGFTFTGNGGLTALGVMIVNAPQSTSDTISISGSTTGVIQMTPPTTGMYAGMTIWQSRSSTNTVSITGNGNFTIAGTFYAQHGQLNVTGNGNNNVVGSQYISDTLVVNGNGTFNIGWNPQQVAKMRLIGLVE
jgi:hypothetical protein